MKMFCDQCGYVDMAHYDGYGFGDRMLEDVMFEVTVAGNKLVTAGVEPSSKSYFSSLNEKMWLTSANEALESVVDDGGDGLNCLNGHSHIITLLNDDGTEVAQAPRPAPVPVKTESLDNMIKIFKGKKNVPIEEFEGYFGEDMSFLSLISEID